MSDARRAFTDIQPKSLRRRAQRIADGMAQLQADVAHWNRLHPNEEPIVVEPITVAEIDGLKAVSSLSADTERSEAPTPPLQSNKENP